MSISLAWGYNDSTRQLRLWRGTNTCRTWDMIVRTLEKVEGMSVPALKAGLGEDWPFESFGEYLDAIDNLGAAINVAVLLGACPSGCM